MKHAKMMTAILLLLAFAMAIFAGCSETPKEAGGISSYDSVSNIPVGDANAGTENSNVGAAEGSFVVSDKTYAYGENNITVLHVENQTDKNYSITIDGVYLDADGEVLQEETKTFAGFPAGWQNYFFFIPGIAFDKFTYTLETAEYDEECIAQNYTLVWSVSESMVHDTEREEKDLQAWEDAYYAEHGEKWVFEDGKQMAKDEFLELYPDFPYFDNYWVDGANLNTGFVYESDDTVMISRSAVVLSADGEVLFANNWPAIIELFPGKEDGSPRGGVSLFADHEEDVPLLEAIKSGEELNVLLGISMIRFYDPALDDPKIPLD